MRTGNYEVVPTTCGSSSATPAGKPALLSVVPQTADRQATGAASNLSVLENE